MTWGRTTAETGLVTATTGPATVTELAVLLDPEAPWVLLCDHSPVLDGGWHGLSVPLAPSQLLHPVPATVRGPRYDVLMRTEEFLALAGELTRLGIVLGQFRRRPDDRVRFDEDRPGSRAAKLLAFGLVVWIELPAAHEAAHVTTLSDEAMDAALGRRPPD